MKSTLTTLVLFLTLSSLPVEGKAQPAEDTIDLSSLLTLFSAHALPGGDIRLNWALEKQSPTIVEFRIYRGYEEVGNFAVAAEVPRRGSEGAVEYSFTDTTAVPGVSYFFKLAASGQNVESVFPVVISATAQLPQKQSAELEQTPAMILPGKRVALYVRQPGHVKLDAVSHPPRALVDDSLRPGIYEFDLSATMPVILKLQHDSGYSTEVVWPIP